jgi:elongation factor P
MPVVAHIRKKNVISYNGEPCLVVDHAIRTPPNMRSFCQMTLRNIRTNKVTPLRVNVGESYDILSTDVRKLEYSYADGDAYTFMDPETFEEVSLNKEILGDALNYLVPSQAYDVLFVEGRPLTVNLGASVTMKVTDAPEGIRGDTSGNVQKSVTVETGMTVRVPLFIKTGDVIKVGTEDGSYLGRA